MSEPPSERTTLHRYAHRATYDRMTIDDILDQGIVCHVGLQTSDKGFPVVIPLAYGRVDDIVYLHGSAASRTFRDSPVAESVEICMTVTHIDGLVVARSTYNTDINYPSVVVIGSAVEVKGPRREAPWTRGNGGAHHSRAEPGCAPANRQGATKHNAPEAAVDRILRQGEDRVAL